MGGQADNGTSSQGMVIDSTIAQEILQQALDSFSGSPQPKPETVALIRALQQTERSSKRDAATSLYSQLVGTWRLVFTSPSPKTGRWIPQWLPIQITFRAEPLPDLPVLPSTQSENNGSVYNQVQLGKLTLILRGPTLFQPKRCILAFDFTQLTLTLWGKVLYDGSLRGGTQQALQFYEQSLKQQAFFRFFWMTPQGIAARGKGGGVALWAKNSAD